MMLPAKRKSVSRSIYKELYYKRAIEQQRLYVGTAAVWQALSR